MAFPPKSIRDLLSIRNRHHPFPIEKMLTREQLIASGREYAMKQVDASYLMGYSVQGDIVYLHKIYEVPNVGNALHAIYQATVDQVDAESDRIKAEKAKGNKPVSQLETIATFLGYAFA